MGFSIDPVTGLKLLELSHVWSSDAPSYPGQEDVTMKRAVKHSQHGVLAWKIGTVMHTGTHMNAPAHLIQKGADLADITPGTFFGNGVILDIPKNDYEVITQEDLEKAGEVKDGDIVVIDTGWHHKYSDSLEYYGRAPGLTKDAAKWLVEKGSKVVGVDTPFIDHPLATSMAEHRGGPHMKRLTKEYEEATGKKAKEEHGEWNVAHKVLLAAGIPTIEQVGGELDLLKGKRATFCCTPWKFAHGDACQVRFVAMVDPSGKLRIDSGN